MCAKRKKQDFNGKHNITIQLKIADDEEFYLIFKLVPFFLSQKSFKDPLFEICNCIFDFSGKNEKLTIASFLLKVTKRMHNVMASLF